MSDDETFELNQRASIKLLKMSKSYNWEIKLVSKTGEITEEMKEQLKKHNNDMVAQYGEQI